jgi:hypothetical protein
VRLPSSRYFYVRESPDRMHVVRAFPAVLARTNIDSEH